jgi:hypothetical protein
MSRKCGVIVDGFGPGNLLPDAFIKNGIDLIHVNSQLDNNNNLFKGNYDPSKYVESLGYFSDLGSLTTKVKETAQDGSILFVIPGSEIGVDLAEQLANKLGLPSNDISIGRVRRDKFLMQERLSECKVRSIKGVKVKDKQEALNWIESNGIKKAVVKPLDSAGCDTTKICNGTKEIWNAVDAIIGKTNMMGEFNHQCLVQEFIVGLEIVVNSFSFKGEHYITDSWSAPKSQTPGGEILYDKLLPLTPDYLQNNKIDSYIRSVLTALGIQNGPSHCEVMMTADGPVLIECGARLDGFANPAFYSKGLERSGLELIHSMYSSPASFVLPKGPYVLDPRLCMFVPTITKEGRINVQELEKELSQMPEIIFYRLKVDQDKLVACTIDLSSTLGIFYIKGEKVDDVDKIRARITIIIQKWTKS